MALNINHSANTITTDDSGSTKLTFLTGGDAAVQFTGDLLVTGQIGSNTQNSYGNRTVSTGTPVNGANGDIWYQYE